MYNAKCLDRTKGSGRSYVPVLVLIELAGIIDVHTRTYDNRVTYVVHKVERKRVGGEMLISSVVQASLLVGFLFTCYERRGGSHSY